MECKRRLMIRNATLGEQLLASKVKANSPNTTQSQPQIQMNLNLHLNNSLNNNNNNNNNNLNLSQQSILVSPLSYSSS
jgi:hypothetical protein